MLLRMAVTVGSLLMLMVWFMVLTSVTGHMTVAGIDVLLVIAGATGLAWFFGIRALLRRVGNLS